MVDRAFALWQSLYPNSYVEPQKQSQSTFWYNTGSIQDVNSPLKPFHSDSNGNFWTSNSVRDLTAFGYTYPELINSNPSSVRTSINNLYGSGNVKFLKARDNTNINANITNTNTTTPIPSRLWQINVRSPKNVLNGSYFIDFFHGQPATEDPTTWPTDPSLIGSHAVISMQMPNMPVVTTTGAVPLNAALDDLCRRGSLSNLSEASVMSVLRDGLTWRVRMGDNQCVPIEWLPEMKVAVASVVVRPPRDVSEFPTFMGPWEVYPAVTNGKPGGLHFDDPI
jgi:tyrosinase